MNFYRANPSNNDTSALYRVSDGGTLLNTTGFEKYANNIELNSEAIVGGKLVDLRSMFYGCTNLNSNILFKQSNIKRDMTGIFGGCTKLNSQITFENMDSSNCLSMFDNCRNLNHEIDMRNVNCSNFSYAFQNCVKMSKIVKFPFQANYFFHCFDNCDVLTDQKIIVNVISSGQYMFYRANNLRNVHINAQLLSYGYYQYMFPYASRLGNPLNLYFSNRIGLTESQKESVIATMIGGNASNWVKNNENHWYMPVNSVHVYFNQVIVY